MCAKYLFQLQKKYGKLISANKDFYLKKRKKVFEFIREKKPPNYIIINIV